MEIDFMLVQDRRRPCLGLWTKLFEEQVVFGYLESWVGRLKEILWVSNNLPMKLTYEVILVRYFVK